MHHFINILHYQHLAVCFPSCLTLGGTMDGSPPGCSIHGIFWARLFASIAISYSRGSSHLRDQTRISCIISIGRRILYHWCHLGSPSVLIENTTQISQNVSLSNTNSAAHSVSLTHYLDHFLSIVIIILSPKC